MGNPPVRMRKYIIRAVLILAILIVVSSALLYGAFHFTTDSGFCVKCHEMQPEYLTWQASSHSKVSCKDCHNPPVLTEQVKEFPLYVKRVILHFTGNFSDSIKPGPPMSQKTCLQCHRPDLETEPGIDLKIPHARHINKGMPCVSCHRNVVHGGISERGINSSSAPVIIDKKSATEQVSLYYTQVSMEQCVNCHREKNIPNKCETCHATFTRPDNHNTATWIRQHGTPARKNISQCNICHSYTNKTRYGEKEVQFNLTEVQYARNNTFCNECHTSRRPTSHGQEPWLVNHGMAFQGNLLECFICHDKDKPGDDYAVEGTYCNKCHGKIARALNDYVRDAVKQ